MSFKAQSLSVLTLNVWNREGPWPIRLSLIRSWIHRLQPDLIGFQEAADANHAQELLNDCNFHSDFNTDPESAEIRYLKGLQSLQGSSAYWCDAWDHAGDGGKGTTWSKSNDFAAWAPWPNRRIDYIFVAQPRLDGAGTIEHCSVVCNEKVDDVWPSDHFGVLARVRVR